MYANNISFADNSISMKTATLSDFRQKMKKHLDEIHQDHDILVLTGPKKKDFVVMTLAAYNSMEETAYILSTAANAKDLFESIEQSKAGKVVHAEPDENGVYHRVSKKKKKMRASK